MSKFVAFLLGINVGGHRRMKMVDVKAAFEELGFENVKTLLASGNVIFEANLSPTDIKEKIEKKLLENFGFDVKIILRSIAQIKKIIAADPFKNIPVTKNTRLYVLFLGEKHHSTLALPYFSPLKDFEVFKIDGLEVYSVLNLTPQTKTTDCMNILGKEFGKNTTMRNWNTVLKLVQ